MTISPDEIQHKQFTVARLGKGYDQSEVDDFLDAVTVDYTDALRRLEAAETRLKAAVDSAAQSASAPTQALPVAASGGPTLATLQLMLENAQNTVDQLKADADAKAQQILATAQYQANQVLGEANVKAQQTVGEAQAEAAKIGSKVSELKNIHASVSATLADALGRLADDSPNEGGQ